mmetsp:Transcript_96394/g.155536  ORF Transcript_96394/g.155536 Transcript_96394/m.155536 type:complete len:85 (-) Transcript_96394:106-360(-)
MLVIFLCVSNACHLYVCLCVFRCTQWAPDRDAEKDCADVGEEKREKHTLVGDEDEEDDWEPQQMLIPVFLNDVQSDGEEAGGAA